MILCPIGAGVYTMLYLFPAFLTFLTRTKEYHTKIDYIFATGYILLFMPLQLPGKINKIFIITILPAMLAIHLIGMLIEFSKSKNPFFIVIKNCLKSHANIKSN